MANRFAYSGQGKQSGIGIPFGVLGALVEAEIIVIAAKVRRISFFMVVYNSYFFDSLGQRRRLIADTKTSIS